MDDEAALVKRALAGDSTAFDELFTRCRPGLVRFIALIIGDADDAESLAQEALTRTYAQLSTFRTETRFGAWLRGIALNLCRNHLRARRRHAKLVSPEVL